MSSSASFLAISLSTEVMRFEIWYILVCFLAGVCCFVVNNKYIAATNGFKLCSFISVNTHMRSKSIVKIQQS